MKPILLFSIILENFTNFFRVTLVEIKEWIEFIVNNIPGKSGFFLRKYFYKKFLNGIDHNQKLYNFSNKSEDHKNWGFRMWYRIRKKIDKIKK